MKHTKKKKLLAFVLCMVLVLSTAITAFAVDGNFYYVPKDTVELSHEIMKDGASQGTLYATVPGGAFKSSTDNAELQMDMQEETSESTVLEAVQTELENTGNTGYTVHQAVMGLSLIHIFVTHLLCREPDNSLFPWNRSRDSHPECCFSGAKL